MKMRRLPEIDLARLIHRTKSEMRLHLQAIEEGSFPALTYNPTRMVVPDLLNQQGDLLDGEPAKWEFIEEIIKKNVRKGELELKQNLAVSKLLHNYAIEKKIWSKRHEFFPIKIAYAGGVKFWWDLYFIENNQAVVPFVDPRLTRGLTQEDMRVVFSFMHERIRVPGSDFENSRLAIFQFPKRADNCRELKVTYDDGFKLYSFDELSTMVGTLYSEWDAELAARAAAKKTKEPVVGGLFS